LDKSDKRIFTATTGPDNVGTFFIYVAFFCSLIALSIYIWASACGVNRKDEISAGAVALAIMAAWPMFLATISWALSGGRETTLDIWGRPAALALIPGGIGLILQQRDLIRQQVLAGMALSALIHFLLAAFFVLRFGKIEHREVSSPQIALRRAKSVDWLGPPRRSPFTAILWKQVRESVPIALAGLAIVVATTVLYYIVDRDSRGKIDELAIGVSINIGFVLAMVVGIGVVFNDMKPGINSFWRSRPIDSDKWFWIKFVGGVFMLLAAIYGPLFLLAMFGYESPLDLVPHPDAWIFPTSHITLFAAAVAMTCLVRQAVYAAILSIVATVSGILVVGLLLTAAGRVGWLERPREHLLDMTEQQVILGLAISFVVCTVVAWLAVRNDWGQKAVR
jgi:hypothetical protein